MKNFTYTLFLIALFAVTAYSASCIQEGCTSCDSDGIWCSKCSKSYTLSCSVCVPKEYAKAVGTATSMAIGILIVVIVVPIVVFFLCVVLIICCICQQRKKRRMLAVTSASRQNQSSVQSYGQQQVFVQ